MIKKALRTCGLTAYETTPIRELLDYGEGSSATVPDKFQPPAIRDWAKRLGMAVSTLERALAHDQFHGWLVTSCRREGCGQASAHQGRGHKARYGVKLGERCEPATCAHLAERRKVPREPAEKYRDKPPKSTETDRVSPGQVAVSYEGSPKGKKKEWVCEHADASGWCPCWHRAAVALYERER
jgi:hypothetical protein